MGWWQKLDRKLGGWLPGGRSPWETQALKNAPPPPPTYTGDTLLPGYPGSPAVTPGRPKQPGQREFGEPPQLSSAQNYGVLSGGYEEQEPGSPTESPSGGNWKDWAGIAATGLGGIGQIVGGVMQGRARDKELELLIRKYEDEQRRKERTSKAVGPILTKLLRDYNTGGGY